MNRIKHLTSLLFCKRKIQCVHYIKGIFTVVPVIKIEALYLLMVLKEVYDPSIFTYITAIVDLALVHNV